MPDARKRPWLGLVFLPALVVGSLRMLPFLSQLLRQPEGRQVPLPIGFVVSDWLQYAALIRQGGAPFVDPFTTEPQSGRFVLLLHQALGFAHTLTGLDVFWLLELARFPLLVAFFAALALLLQEVFASPAHRLWAVWLVALAGGLLWPIRLLLPLLPERLAAPITADVWDMYGWTPFEAAFNPLWLASLTLLLLALRPLLLTEAALPWRQRARTALSLVILHLTHVYGALMWGAAVLGMTGLELALGRPRAWLRLREALVCALLAALVIAPVTVWQFGDPVLRAASGGVIGSQGAGLFWLPMALGGLLWFLLRRGVLAGAVPVRLLGWALALVWLASTTVANGYHFIFGLALPLTLLAAPAVGDWFGQQRGKAAPTAMALLLFGGTLATTLADVRAADEHRVDADALAVVTVLAPEPAARVIAPAPVARLIPALTAHRVWFGHWFLTPNYPARTQMYKEFIGAPAEHAAGFAAVLVREDITWLVVPTTAVAEVTAALPHWRPSWRGAALTLLRRPSP